MTTLSSIEQAIVQAVSRERLMADTQAIAQWVRLSGTEDERKAFEYIASMLRQCGVEPTLYTGYGLISLPISAQLRAGQKELRAITHAMAVSTPEEGLQLSAVYVGSGGAESYASRNVQGKAVIIDGIAMPAKVLTAQRAGAAACIFVNQDEHVHEMIVSSIWGSPTPENRHQLPHIPVISLGKEDGDTLRDMFDAGQPVAPRFIVGVASTEQEVAVRLRTQVSTRWTQIPTLIAQVDGQAGGKDEQGKFILFSGHVDSWHYGAMDNGSANATMLETLRAVLPYRHTFRRGLRLAFWSGHSHGRYAGSTWYADNFWEDLEANCVAHINVDSVGGQNATVLSEAPTMAEMQPCAAQVIQALTGIEYNGTRFSRAGDQSFQGHGIPSLFMSLSEQPPRAGDSAAELFGGSPAKSGGLGWWWHTTEDTADKIDPALLVRDTQIYAAIIYHYLSTAILPLNIKLSADDLLQHLCAWQQKAGERFDLSMVVKRAEEVQQLATQLQTRLDNGADKLPPATISQLNEIIQAAEKPLVRLNYTSSDPYAYDPALGQPPVPLLAPIDALVAASPESDTAHELLTLLVRRRNRVMHELAEAQRKIEQGLALLE
ncbi:MAG TPA: M28 family metallopeptidase [Ktedonosporobacter sp.]|jgi:Iap family predicted aminopeptidase|nr:M28 family metallopeptidase [Ktedonosporobacter sp.]